MVNLGLELRDALLRIANRWILIVTLMLTGVGLATVITLSAPETYTSTTRLLLTVPVSAEQSDILAGVARAIVTSPSRINDAMDDAGETEGMTPSVAVEPLGGTGVVELRVSHPERDTALSVARYLANDLIEGGLRPEPGTETDGGPVLIEAAVAPDEPDAVPLVLNIILGAIAGLVLGVSVAALLEAFNPQLTTSREVAKVVGGPPLGSVPTPFERLKPEQVEPIAIRIQVAARYAGVARVELVSDSAGPDLVALTNRLQASVDYWGDSEDYDGTALPLLDVVPAGSTNGHGTASPANRSVSAREDDQSDMAGDSSSDDPGDTDIDDSSDTDITGANATDGTAATAQAVAPDDTTSARRARAALDRANETERGRRVQGRTRAGTPTGQTTDATKHQRSAGATAVRPDETAGAAAGRRPTVASQPAAVRSATGLVIVVAGPTGREGPELARDVLAGSDRKLLGVITYR